MYIYEYLMIFRNDAYFSIGFGARLVSMQLIAGFIKLQKVKESFNRFN